MPEVPEHLVPTDGLTNSTIRFAGYDPHDNDAGATVRFDILDENGDYIGTINIETYPTNEGTIDAMVVRAYRRLTDMVRGWLYHVDQMRDGYENKRQS